MGRALVTKAIGFTDEIGDKDIEDITDQYKNPEGTWEERLSVFNAVRGVDKAKLYYEIPNADLEDVKMDLVELEKVNYGQPYQAVVVLEVNVVAIAEIL